MKPVAAIAFALLILVQPLYNLGVLANYYIDYNYIAEVLCINQDKPELQCNGMCQVKQQLAEHSDNTSEGLQLINKAEQTFLAYSPVYFPLALAQSGNPTFTVVLNLGQPQKYSGAIFHPPSLA